MPRLLLLTALVAGLLLTGAGPASAATRQSDMWTSSELTPGRAHAYGVVDFEYSTRVTVRGRLNDVCNGDNPGDGHGAYLPRHGGLGQRQHPGAVREGHDRLPESGRCRRVARVRRPSGGSGPCGCTCTSTTPSATAPLTSRTRPSRRRDHEDEDVPLARAADRCRPAPWRRRPPHTPKPIARSISARRCSSTMARPTPGAWPASNPRAEWFSPGGSTMYAPRTASAPTWTSPRTWRATAAISATRPKTTGGCKDKDGIAYSFDIRSSTRKITRLPPEALRVRHRWRLRRVRQRKVNASIDNPLY